MDMAQRPVVEARALEGLEVRGGVPLMIRGSRGVDHLRVEYCHLGEATVGGPKTLGQILRLGRGLMSGGGHRAHGVSAGALHRDAYGLALPRHSDVAGPRQIRRSHAFAPGIMVSCGVHYGDARLREAEELLQEEALRLERQPSVVEEISGHEDGVDPLIEGQIHESSKRDTRRFPQPRTDRVRAGRECGVEVYVGGVNEAHQLPGIVNAWAGVPKLDVAGGRGPGLKGRYCSARASADVA